MYYGILDNAKNVSIHDTKKERDEIWKTLTKTGRKKKGWIKVRVRIETE